MKFNLSNHVFQDKHLKIYVEGEIKLMNLYEEHSIKLFITLLKEELEAQSRDNEGVVTFDFDKAVKKLGGANLL